MRNFRLYWIAIIGIILFSIITTAVYSYFYLTQVSQKQSLMVTQRTQALHELKAQLELPFHLSRWMRDDVFLAQWIINGEKEPSELFAYLGSVNRQWKYSSFLASCLTKNYYFSDGTTKHLDPAVPDVEWFFDLLETGVDELADVGYHNGDPNKPFLYIDMKVSQENYPNLGYVGVAAELGPFLQLLKDFRDQFGEDLHFVNQKGMVLLSSCSQCVNTKASQYDWYDPSVVMSGAAEEATQYKKGDSQISSVYMEPIGWYMFVEKDLKTGQGYIGQIILRTVLFSLFMVILVGGVLAYLIRHFRWDLKEAFNEIKQLKGILPICASCKKIRDDEGYWHQVEGYLRSHTEVDFTHSICADCASKLYPEYTDSLSDEMEDDKTTLSEKKDETP